MLKAAFRFDPLIDIMKKAELKKGKKAQMTSSFGIFNFIIFSLLVVVFFGGLIFAMGLINNVMHQAGVINDAQPRETFTFPCIDNASATCTGSTYVNMTLASDQIFGQQAESIKALRMVAVVYILGLATVIILVNVFVRRHPILFFAQILVGILAILFAPPISNAYQNLLNSGIYGGELANFTAANFILLNLPTFVLVITILGTLLSLINIVRAGGEDTRL